MVLSVSKHYKMIKTKISNLFVSRPTWKEIIISCICGLVLVVTAFPEVSFMGATLRLGDIDFHLRTNFNDKPINIFPIAPHRDFTHAQVDRAGAFLQSEPGMEFIRISLQNRESPFWNPYVATGALGPETLADNKFAVINWIYALMGGGQRIHDLLLLAAIWLAAACIHRFLRGVCNLSQPAAWAGAAIYIFNGYSVANLGSNVTWSFYFMPACLLACCRLLEQASPRRLAVAAITIAIVLSFTFVPTTTIGLLVVATISLCCLVARIKNKRQLFMGVLHLIMAGAIAFFLVAIIYLPIAENLLFDSADVATFNERQIPVVLHFMSLFSLLSSSHFFESYFAFEHPMYSAWHGLHASTVYHIGIVAAFLAGFSIIAKNKTTLHRILCWSSIVIIFLVLARIYGLPGYSWLISQVPVIGRFNTQYQWAGLMLPVTFLVAFGLNTIMTQQIDKKLTRRSLTIIWGIIIFLGFAVYITGRLDPVTGRLDDVRWVWHIRQIQHLLIMAIFMILTTLLIVFTTSVNENIRKRICGLSIAWKNLLGLSLALLLTINLFSEFKTMYFIVPDLYATIRPEVQFLRDNSGLHRSLGIGPFVSIQPEKNVAWEVYTIGSANMAVMPAYTDFFHNNINICHSQRVTTFISTELVHDTPEMHDINIFALDMVGVKHLVFSYYWQNYITHFKEYGFTQVAYFREPTRTVILENQNVWPRAFVVPIEYLKVENGVTLKPEMRNVLYEANIIDYRHTSLTIQGSSERNGLVVLTDNWHRNWSAQLNGEDIEITVVHGTFRGVYIPAGDFVITMRYRPSTLNIAMMMGLSAILCLVGLLVPSNMWGKLRRRETIQ